MYSSWTLQLPRTSICYTQTKWQKLEIYLLPVQCLTSASKGQSLHISSFGPTECKDTLLGKHVKWQRVDACILKFLLNVLFTFKRLQSMLRSNGIARYFFGNKLGQNVWWFSRYLFVCFRGESFGHLQSKGYYVKHKMLILHFLR